MKFGSYVGSHVLYPRHIQHGNLTEQCRLHWKQDLREDSYVDSQIRLDIPRQWYARGEVAKEEFDRIKKDMEE